MESYYIRNWRHLQTGCLFASLWLVTVEAFVDQGQSSFLLAIASQRKKKEENCGRENDDPASLSLDVISYRIRFM